MIRVASWLVLVTCLAAAPAVADYKLEKGIAVPEEIPAAVRELVEAQGLRVLNDAGAPYAELWLHKALAAAAKPAAGDVLYGGIEQGSFLGVWRFVAKGADFRGQSIDPGFYTMRYALMPADGNHMGVAQYRDFVLLVPLATDTNPAAALGFSEIAALSRKASGTGHPAIIPLDPPEPAADPTLAKNDAGSWILRTKLATKDGASLPIAITIFGRAEQ